MNIGFINASTLQHAVYIYGKISVTQVIVQSTVT